MASKTPETLTAVERADRLALQAQPAANFFPDSMTKPSKQEKKIIDLARKTLPPLSGPRPSATADLDPRRDVDDSFSILPIEALELYRHNPRQGPNPRYKELKESIRTSGITNVITVTRRSPDDKFAPYGGGNTRLQIAKELHAEGDQRFAHLKVVIKDWPGDAQVITAHLAENDLRGDITFWERARGVQQFRIELQRERGRPLTAGELNRELKASGLNYGVRTIQNFAFATDELAEIGPWLKSTQVNELIRPAVAALLELGTKLGVEAPLRTRLQAVMKEHGDDLRQREELSEDLEPAERVPIELDTTALLSELEQAGAEQFGIGAAQLASMLAALANDPRATPETLRAAAEVAFARAPAAPPAVTVPDPVLGDRPVGAESTQATPTTQQAPLPGMLAGVPTTLLPATPEAVSAPAQASSRRTAEPVFDDAREQIRTFLGQINETVPLHDVIYTMPSSMPFGFIVDLPEQDMAHALGVPVLPDRLALRTALWKLLAALTYQYDQRVLSRVPAEALDKTIWGRAFSAGRQAFEQACATHAGIPITGEQYPMGTQELALVLGEADVSYSFIKLLAVMEEVRLHFPERVPQGFQALFSQ